MTNPDGLLSVLQRKVFGQDSSLSKIVESIQVFDAGLSPVDRPAGVFLLLGPTGTGKTKTVEAVAESLHGCSKKMLKVDCGEFQMEHEVSKLIGAPPGYLGHRDTQPVFTREKLAAVTSQYSDLSVILFDEIEKAAPSMVRLLLGILDKGTLRLGDNAIVNFEKSIIFLTSNLGARAMHKSVAAPFGLPQPVNVQARQTKITSIATHALHKKFTPEFMNRIDAVSVYHPLDAPAMVRILDAELDSLQQHIDARLGDKTFTLEIDKPSKRYLIKNGTSAKFGARELKRLIHYEIVQPLAQLVSAHIIPARGVVRVTRSFKGLSVTPHQTVHEIEVALKELLDATA